MSHSDDSNSRQGLERSQDEKPMDYSEGPLQMPVEVPRSITPAPMLGVLGIEHNYGQPCPHCPSLGPGPQCYHGGMMHRNSPMPFRIPLNNLGMNHGNDMDEPIDLRSTTPTDQQGTNDRSTPKETVIEITKIATPSEGYFSRENLRKTQDEKVNLTDQFSKLSSGPFSRLTHPRKSPPLKRFYRTPSPPRIQAQPPPSIAHSMNSSGCYFSGPVRPRPASALGASSSHCSADPSYMSNFSCATAMLRAATPNPTTTCAHSGKNSITVKSNGVTRTIAILNRNRALSHNVVHPQPVRLKPPHHGLSSESHHCERGEGKLNTSLTNIQWLGEMKGIDGENSNDGSSRPPASSSSSHQKTSHKDLRVIASDKQIAQISAECGRSKRPPYSYMHLIQMAICSKEDRHLTLREIYKWIEDKFPYYKYHPNQGWKNSIRHNLSLYDIFIRKKIAVPGKSGTSYWTLREDASKAIVMPTKEETKEKSSSPVPDPLVVLPNSQNSEGSKSTKKAPVPLLPKPDPQQAYALIPIQGGVPVMSSQPIIVPANWALSKSGQIHAPDSSKSGQKRSHSPSGGPRKKQIKIAPKIDASNLSLLSDSSWLSNISSATMSSFNASSLTGGGSVLDTTDLQAQLAHIKFVDSGIEASITSTDLENSNDAKPELFNIKTESEGGVNQEAAGLPKPVMYTEIKYKRNTPRKSKRKQKLPSPSPPKSRRSSTSSTEKDSAVFSSYTTDGAESGIGDILAGIEKELPSPVKMLLQTPPKDKDLVTSTPFRGGVGSPSGWISPIRGLTPDSTDSNLERALFTPPPDNGKKTSTPLESNLDTPDTNLCTPSKGVAFTPFTSYGSLGASPLLKIEKSPQIGSLRSFGIAGLTPLKSPNHQQQAEAVSPGLHSNASFNKLFGDFHLDSINAVEDGNMDLSNFSFSAFQ